MIRAGVFIGVDKTGNLKKLNDAAQGARRVYQWALSQGIDETNAKLITDENGERVSIDSIYSAIKSIIDGAGVDQLIIYFAGHGIYNRYSELWLLSDAPIMTSAAVNVHGSVELARYCGVKHVVFISDACRVSASGIQALNVFGTEIFPNEPTIEGKVDQFFACSRGKFSFEYKDDSDAAVKYIALYTTALLEALNGTQLDAIDLNQTRTDSWYYVTPPKLDSYLKSDLPRRVQRLKLQNEVSQDPSAIVVVGGSWMSRIDPAQIDLDTVNQHRKLLKKGYGSDGKLSSYLMQLAFEGDGYLFDLILKNPNSFTLFGESDEVSDTIAILYTPFGPDHYEFQCGFKIRGARIAEFFALGLSAELVGETGDLLRIHTEKVVNVLLRFEGNFGTVIPAIPGYMTALSFDEGDLISVAYEPSYNTDLGKVFKISAYEIRALRAVAASFSKYSRFSLDQENVSQIEQIISTEREFDPSVSIYVAYAYYDMQQIDRIRSEAVFQNKHLGVTFFDIALLGRFLLNKYVDSITPTEIANVGLLFPFVPMLTQGWALLKANRVKLHPALIDLEDNLLDSLWSLYDSIGLEKLKRAMQQPLSQ